MLASKKLKGINASLDERHERCVEKKKLEEVLIKSKRTVFLFQPSFAAVHLIKSEDSDLRIYELDKVVFSHL